MNPNPTHGYVKAYIAWFEFSKRNSSNVPSFSQRLSIQDSILLNELAVSGTPFALNACMVLQSAYQGYLCNYEPASATSLDDNNICNSTVNYRIGEKNSNLVDGTEISLGNAYPNPAKTEVTINYNVPKQSLASIRLYEIATGKVITEFPINSEELNATIPLTDCKPGIYCYTLMIDGAPLKTKNLAIIR